MFSLTLHCSKPQRSPLTPLMSFRVLGSALPLSTSKMIRLFPLATSKLKTPTGFLQEPWSCQASTCSSKPPTATSPTTAHKSELLTSTLRKGKKKKQHSNQFGAALKLSFFLSFFLSSPNSVVLSGVRVSGGSSLSSGCIGVGTDGGILIEDSVISDCSSGETGGVLQIGSGTNVTILRTTITSSHADQNGGAIYISAPQASFYMADSSIIGSTAYDGGVVSISTLSGNATFVRVNFTSNSALESGGFGLASASASLTFQNCNFFNHTAESVRLPIAHNTTQIIK